MTRNLCNNNEFWRRYIEKNYYINIDKNTKEIAYQANKVLIYLFSRNVYPSFRVLPFIFEHLLSVLGDNNRPLTLRIILDSIVVENTLLSMNVVGNGLSKVLSGEQLEITERYYNGIRSDIISNISEDPILSNLKQFTFTTKQEQQFFMDCSDFVLQPTVYLTSEGHVNIDIDNYDLTKYLYRKFQVSASVLISLDGYLKILLYKEFGIVDL